MRAKMLLALLLAVTPASAWAQASPRLERLEQRLETLATENPGEFGFAALDLTTGEAVSVNGDRAFPMASTMKIAVAAAYLAEVDAGRRSLDDDISGTSAGRLMDAMIVHSDNRATDLLIGALGGPGTVNAWMQRHGLRDIRVDRNIAQLLADRRDLRDVRDSSTPRGMIGLLRIINAGPALSAGSRQRLLDMMRRCATGSNRIRGILPPGATVEHKTGTLNNYTGDVGFLVTPGGRRIAVAFFARFGENRPAIIATAARAIYDAFEPSAEARAAFNR